MWTHGAMGANHLNYAACMTGRLFSCPSNPQAAAVVWFGDGAYDETTPIILFRNPAASGRLIILQEIYISLTNTPGSAASFEFVADTVDRLDPFTGVLRVPSNGYIMALNEGLVASVLELYDEGPLALPSAMVAGSAPRLIDSWELPAAPGGTWNCTWNGSVVLRPGSSAMMYSWSTAGAMPQGRYRARWVEEDIGR